MGDTLCDLEVTNCDLKIYFGAKSKALVKIPDEMVARRIFSIRGENVMLDSELAQLYGVETKVLKQ